MQIAIGHSSNLDSEEATEEVIAMCREQIGEATPGAALLFCSVDHELQEVVTAIHDALPTAELIGCTTDGELSSALGFVEDSIALMVICSDGISFAIGVGHGVFDDPGRAAADAIAEARAKLPGEPVLCLTTPQGLKSTGNRVVQGLINALGEQVPIAGGISADPWLFEQTYQFHAGEVLTNSVPVLLLSGPLKLSRGAWSGWMPVGSRAVATPGDGRVVTHIGSRTAVEFIQKYLGRDAKPSSECPLAVFAPGASDFYLRSVVAHDEQEGTITLAERIPEGSELGLTQATRDNILLGAERSLAQAIDAYPGERPELGLFFSCGGRRHILGTRCAEEEQVIRRLTPDGVPYVGFYAYGEVGPLSSGTGNDTAFHSETLVSVFLGEGE